MGGSKIKQRKKSGGLLSLFCRMLDATGCVTHRCFDSCLLRRFGKCFLFVIIAMQIPFIVFLWNSGEAEETHYEVRNSNYDRIKSICDDIWTRDRTLSKKSQKLAALRNQQLYYNKNNTVTDQHGRILCPSRPPGLKGRLEFHYSGTPPTFKEIAENNPNLRKGGFYYPPNCEARSKLAIIIPYRAREHHLRVLLSHLHPILQRQQLYYKIFVIQQAGYYGFNKAKLMNIGYIKASQDDDYECFIFHDVDLLLEDDRLLYACKDPPRHLSVSIDKYQYRLPYEALIGGVAQFGRDQFRELNGYSNKYWGWGGEDDDMFYRNYYKGFTISRPPFHLGRFKMSFHHRDKGNSLNLIRHELLQGSIARMHEDGVNSVKYSMVSVNRNPIYTNITVDVGRGEIRCKNYLSSTACRLSWWACENVGLSCGLLQLFSTDDGNF